MGGMLEGSGIQSTRQERGLAAGRRAAGRRSAGRRSAGRSQASLVSDFQMNHVFF